MHWDSIELLWDCPGYKDGPVAEWGGVGRSRAG